MPKWLRIDYLKPCKGVDNHIIPDKNLNNRIQTRAGLWKNGDVSVGIDCSIDAVGTLGPIMKSKSNVYFGLTAGHVLLDGDRELVVKTEDEELKAILKVAERYLRSQGRPIGRLEDRDQVGFQDEIILLEIGVQDIDKFNTVLYCVNCHCYMPDNVNEEEAADPMAYLRGYYLAHAIRKEGPIKVYKFGSATGLTTGHLISVEYASPPGWYERADGESESDSSSITDPVVFESDSEGTKSDSDEDPKEEDNSDEGNDGKEKSKEGDEESEHSDEESENVDEESENGDGESVMVDSRHPNTPVITTKADQLIVITTPETVVSKRGGILMVDSRHPNTPVITTKADQIVTITTPAGNNLMIQWFHGSLLGCMERLVGQRGNWELSPHGITGVMVACKC